ncbi:hypothetical protein QJ850_gp578 [Acanthamoeba polyphaga mimivirus]|uniref:Uncharacterized protein n=1 Tax=Acanthamoeba polyphaga mimivirus Kroon TaxID=3069720 RepID=A0A0G2YAK7_9VIRU|nr:hypothetical protein QJ850_gp578 [Acanthamoeba polyphaga mimivirus]AKI80121.1 hypothetical protein [Acanthamoeba polyphaga mimivirus Kroon]
MDKKTWVYIIIAIIIILLLVWYFRNHMSDQKGVNVNNQTYNMLQQQISSLNQQILFLKQQIGNLHVPAPTSTVNSLRQTVNDINQQVSTINNQISSLNPYLPRNQQLELASVLSIFNRNALDLNNISRSVINRDINYFNAGQHGSQVPQNPHTVQNPNVTNELNVLQQKVDSLNGVVSNITQRLSQFGAGIPKSFHDEAEKAASYLNDRIDDINKNLPNLVQRLNPEQRNYLNRILNELNNDLSSLKNSLGSAVRSRINSVNIH